MLTSESSSVVVVSSDVWKIESKDPKEFRTMTVESLKLMESIQKFEAGEFSIRTFAEKIMAGLLALEFVGSGKHWSWDGYSANNHRKEDDFDVFDCEDSYTWDWKDIYSVAKATATIGINLTRKLITVKDYHYYCAG